MQKKALAMNMVVLLVIALIALVIIGFLIAKGSGIYSKSTSCEGAGGKCVTQNKCGGEQSFLAGCKEGQVCCIVEDLNE